ncbi:carbohydrate-binding protein [Deinococcus planocerae]|uniref:carbohydrate-binding protein n=1 Tax=Deinococcus planocerae TaxID=1737569 RepID=UPI0015E0979C|nr:carbohydrate-binding protein [Deinococcus planocerae]
MLWCLALSPGLAAVPSPAPFQLSRLEQRPANISISPGYITLLDFPADVTKVVSGNGLLLRNEVIGNRVVLSAAKTAGQTDLLVTTGGRVAMFVVQIDGQGQAPRRYAVVQDVPAAQTPAPPSRPVAARVPVRPTMVPAQPVRPAAVVSAQPARPAAVVPAQPVRPVAVAPVTGPAEVASLLGRYEAERAVLYRARVVPSSTAEGGQHVGYINSVDSRVTFPSVRAPSNGTYTLRIRYANGSPETAIQPLWVNEVSTSSVRYPVTGGWERYANVDVQVVLRAGVNTLRFGKERRGVNLDVLELWGLATGVAVSPPAPVPPARLP